jgi:hypothetical protein
MTSITGAKWGGLRWILPRSALSSCRISCYRIGGAQFRCESRQHASQYAVWFIDSAEVESWRANRMTRRSLFRAVALWPVQFIPLPLRMRSAPCPSAVQLSGRIFPSHKHLRPHIPRSSDHPHTCHQVEIPRPQPWHSAVIFV